MNRLPNEILIDIFSYLEYWDLTINIPSTCRRFRAVVDGVRDIPAIATTLFRERAEHCWESEFETYEIHPALALIRSHSKASWNPLDYESKMDGLVFKSRKGNREVKLRDTPAAWENATSPPVPKFGLVINKHAAGRGRSAVQLDAPITVWDLMSLVVSTGLAIFKQNNWKGVDKVEVIDGRLYFFVSYDNRSEASERTTRSLLRGP